MRIGGVQLVINQNAAGAVQSGLLRQGNIGPHASGNDDPPGRNSPPVTEIHSLNMSAFIGAIGYRLCLQYRFNTARRQFIA